MIEVKGTHVVLELDTGRSLRIPGRYGLMHDPSGRAWPRCEVLIGPFMRERRPAAKVPDTARAYFGRKATVLEGSVVLPARRGWTDVGTMKGGRIYYWRGGTKHPGPFKHRFNKDWSSIVLGKRSVVVRRQGRFLSIALGTGCVLDDRGFVIP